MKSFFMDRQQQTKQGELCFEKSTVSESGREQVLSTPVCENNPSLSEATKLTEEEEVLPQYVITADKLLLQDYVEDKYLIQDLVVAGKLGTIVGSSDTGKSLFCKQLAVAIVQRDKEFLGFKLNVEHGSSIYVTTEDDARSFQSYLHKRKIDGDINQFRNLRIIEDSRELEGKLRVELVRKAADAVFIDVFTDAYGGEMNNSTSVRGYLNKFQRLINEFGVSIIFVHHTGKRTENFEPSKNNVLGSQGYESKMRFVGELRRDHNDPSVRHFIVLKANELSDEQKRSSYVLRLGDDLTFYPTGERVIKHELSSNGKHTPLKSQTQVVQMVKDLNSTGLSTRKITAALNERGVKIGKTLVSEILKDPN